MGPAPRLSDATLGQRSAAVAGLGYDRSALSTGIVHLGLGAFFQAHGAAYTDRVLSDGCRAWGITGVSLQRPDQRDRLQPQNGLYTLLERDGSVARARIIGSILEVLVAPENPSMVVARLAHSDTRIASLTITEKGYCHDPATGRLNQAHPDIRHDLEHPATPRTALGFLVAALAQRQAAGLPPLTILCCDNLPHNGRLVAGLVRDMARLRNDRLGNWIEHNVAFPSTMVDRIVPAQTPADLADAHSLTGLMDAAAVAHEPFTQWVIEDTFVDRHRPRWEAAGATFVDDVAPFETMKLRLLNAAHSALAYLGYLGGHETIGDCVADPVYRAYVEDMWRHEIIPVMAQPPGVDLHAYTSALLARFANSAIRHRTWQIAMDGSQKLPQRLLVTLRARLASDLPIDRLALAVAGWMAYVAGRDERGAAIDVRDPLATPLAAAIQAAGADAEAQVRAVLAFESIFGAELGQNKRFTVAMADARRSLITHGARKSIMRAAR